VVLKVERLAVNSHEECPFGCGPWKSESSSECSAGPVPIAVWPLIQVVRPGGARLRWPARLGRSRPGCGILLWMTSRRVKFGLLPAREYVASGCGRSARVDRAVLPALAAYSFGTVGDRGRGSRRSRLLGGQAFRPTGPTEAGLLPAVRSGMPSLVSLPPSIRPAVGRSAAAVTIRVAVSAGRSMGAGSGTLGPGLLTALPGILGRQVWRAPGPGPPNILLATSFESVPHAPTESVPHAPILVSAQRHPSQYPARHPSQYPTRQASQCPTAPSESVPRAIRVSTRRLSGRAC
jgi:hypothetical protein